ncbi:MULTISPECIES: hypothetical protein [Achromobacter]|uniref:hypothetical protein n=1 Tax=Achromobacter TaxID=222 RepID=UPI002FE1CCD2
MSKFGLDPYATIGLTENPFVVHALSADETGERLLVGRDDDIHLVAQRLHKHGKITCLDGHVGVGKTSLVNVAAYKCYRAYLAGETPQLLIPSVVSFQLKKDGNIDEFCAEVFRGVAQTLLKYAAELRQFELSASLSLPQLNAWLNSPIVQHLNENGGAGLNIGIPGVAQLRVNGGAATNSQVNQSSGFSQSGFESLIRQLLNEIFAVQGNGGVVCVIDNIELLETAISARRTLEALRDKLFTVNGLRWVFCGANGVIHSLAASPRLTAFLSTPVIDVKNINPSKIPELIRTRLSEFSSDASKAEDLLPVDLDDLKHLYFLVNSNLRDLLGLADEYCEHYATSGQPIRVRDRKREKFDKWLHKATVDRYQALSSRISSNAWAVLDIAMSKQFSGTFGAGDYESFNKNSTVAFERSTFARWLRDLVKLGLLSKSIDEEQSDEDGFSRDVFTVTAKGALVQYARRKKNENLSLAEPAAWMKRVHH